MDEVLRRAKQTLEWVTAQGWLLDIALDHLSLGRAHMATSPPDPAVAEQHLRAAVDGLRTAGKTTHLPSGLLARAEFHRNQDNLDLAQRDLDEVRTIVRRAGMRLFEADPSSSKLAGTSRRKTSTLPAIPSTTPRTWLNP